MVTQLEVLQLPELNDKQKEVFKTVRDTPYGTTHVIGFGGAMGGGKTHLLARMARQLALDLPGSRILVCRHEFNKLKTTTLEEFDRFTETELIVASNNTDNWRDLRVRSWPKGIKSRVYFRGTSDWASLGSEQFSAILVEEAGETTKMAAIFLMTRLRHPLPQEVVNAFKEKDPNWQMRYYFIAASNPYPGWFTDWFIHKTVDDALDTVPNVKLTFVQSKISDNYKNLPAGYESTQRAMLPPDLVERFIEGRFDVYTDMVYSNFDPKIHKYLRELPSGKQFNNEIDKVVGGLDFGGARPDAHYSAGIVGLYSKTQRLIRVDEFKDRGPGVQERQLRWMMDMQRKWGDLSGRRIRWCADRTQSMGIELLRKLQFRIEESSGQMVDQGIVPVMRRLEPDNNGIPGSFYTPNCVEFEKEIYQYRWDQPSSDNMAFKRVPIKRNDDLMDADRYMEELLTKQVGNPPGYVL